MSNLSLYFPQQDYIQLKGPDWPDYEDFLKGDLGQTSDIQNEITGFLEMFKKDGVKFPIRTKTACQSKWTWSTIYLNQLSTASCHRVNPVPFSLENFDDFHNVPKKLQDRELMLKGQWPTGGCEYCKKIEDAGGWSDRQHNLEIRDLTPPELEQDLSQTWVTPRLVEIFAQNTCNLACLYCNGNLSSKIEQENKKFGEFKRDSVSIPVIEVPTTTREYFERFMSWLDRNIGHLKRLHLLGGETLLQHELMNRCLDIIEQHQCKDLVLNIFSNFNVPDRYWNDYMSRINQLCVNGHLRRFDLTASIDCWGPAAEYVRHGLDLESFERKFSWAAEQHSDWLNLNVNQTITCMTIRTMPELIERIDHYSQNRHIGQYFEFYIGSDYFHHPENFAWNMWQQDFKRIFERLPTRTQSQQEVVIRMDGIAKQLQQKNSHNHREIARLKTYLDEIDRRRGSDWRSLFSYLDV
jgi:hypothetical protein